MDKQNFVLDAAMEEEVDLLVQENDREDNLLQFLQALDLQVLGACRADERFLPLLKTNLSNCAAEDRLLSHLIQHFEAQEIGMLARCLCMPLVSIRVGRVIKSLNLLCPTSIRGNLILSLLPSSNLRISFTEDDGFSERLATLSSNFKNPAVMVEDITADSSGRSFVIKIHGSEFYFWCSEKSKLLGNELLAKMKDLLERMPSLAELTGISEPRLNSFAVHFHEYLLGSTVTIRQANHVLPVTLCNTSAELPDTDASFQMLPPSSKFSPRHSTQIFEDHNCSFGEEVDVVLIPCSQVVDISSSANKEPLGGSFSSLGFFEPQGNSTYLSFPNQLLEDLVGGSHIFSQNYHSGPPLTSTLQYADLPPIVSNSFSDTFPPLSSLLSSNRPLNSFASLNSPHNLVDVNPFDLSAFLSDSVVQLPFSVPLTTVPSSHQIPTFTPLVCDSIVHIPSLGVCSSGQGYMVGTGHGVSSSNTLHSHISNTPISNSDLMVEKGARETLQMLLSSAQTNPWSSDTFPAVLTSDTSPFGDGIAAFRFGELPSNAVCDIEWRFGDLDSGHQLEESGGLEGSSSDEAMNSLLDES